MHISEGVLSAPVLGAGAVLAAVGIAKGLRLMDNRRVPEVAVVASALFVASLVRFPLGPVSVHLTLNGLAGILLGWMACPAVFVALVLQALLFQFGGFTTLGVNTVVMALPAVVAHLICRPLLCSGGRRAAVWAGGIAGAVGVAGGAMLIAISLIATERSLKALTLAFAATHVPVLVVEGAVTAFVLAFLWKVKPELLILNGRRADSDE